MDPTHHLGACDYLRPSTEATTTSQCYLVLSCPPLIISSWSVTDQELWLHGSRCPFTYYTRFWVGLLLRHGHSVFTLKWSSTTRERGSFYVISSQIKDQSSFTTCFLFFFSDSVTGLNFDFLVLNFTKHSCYLIYNAGMFFGPIIQKQYREKYGRNEVGDLIFFFEIFYCYCS